MTDSKKKPPSDLAEKFVVRFPPATDDTGSLRDTIKASADKAGRSMNAEIVHRLEQSFQPHADHEGITLSNIDKLSLLSGDDITAPIKRFFKDHLGSIALDHARSLFIGSISGGILLQADIDTTVEADGDYVDRVNEIKKVFPNTTVKD